MATRSASDGRKGKSATAFRTISEVADELDLPQHVLRFWETKFQIIKPMKRGGGRRYYRPEDIDVLRRIRDLLYDEGYTIKGVQKLLRGGAEKKTTAKESAPGDQKTAFVDDGRRAQLITILDDLMELKQLLEGSKSVA